MGEESGNEFGNKNSDFVWIIDPLDGTTNFIHGFPVYCVSIALSVQGQDRARRGRMTLRATTCSPPPVAVAPS